MTDTQVRRTRNGGATRAKNGDRGKAGDDRPPAKKKRPAKKKQQAKKGGKELRYRARSKINFTDVELPRKVAPWNETGAFPYKKKISRKEYESVKLELQIELLKVQRWVKETGQRVVIIFEGRDAAGKGGTIKRYMEHLNPRGAIVVALEKPSDREMGQWYFQRYTQHLPTTGEMVLFDRSWYNRAGVERVMGFCTNGQYHEFMRQVPDYEQMLINSGVWLVKYWFSVSREEQFRRFQMRRIDPLKQWKLSPVDIASLNKWDEYTDAKERMFFYTSSANSPWTVVRSDDKKRARIECMRHFLNSLPYTNKEKSVVTAPDPLIIEPAPTTFEALHDTL